MKDSDRLKQLYPGVDEPNALCKYRFVKKGSYPSGFDEGEVVELPRRCAEGFPWWEPLKTESTFSEPETVTTVEVSETALAISPVSFPVNSESDGTVISAGQELVSQETPPKKRRRG